MKPGTKVLIDSTVRGTLIGYAASGRAIVDLGHGTTLADVGRLTYDTAGEV